MKKSLLSLLFAFVTLIVGFVAYAKFAPSVSESEAPVDSHPVHSEWLIDFKAAQARSKAENKPILINFTGSDWCGGCVLLDKEVFSQEAFKVYAAKSLVLAEVDFPAYKRQSVETIKQNKALAEEYGVYGFPAILLLSPEGELLGRTTYRPGGPVKYVEHLKEILGEK